MVFLNLFFHWDLRYDKLSVLSTSELHMECVLSCKYEDMHCHTHMTTPIVMRM